MSREPHLQPRLARRRDTAVFGFPLLAVVGALALFGSTNWILWQESMQVEERRVAEISQVLGEETERILVGARDLLLRLNESELPRCSEEHIKAMHRAAVARPHIRGIGYWQATERLCGVGYIQEIELKPSRADRIYESGMLAWWPGPQTRVGSVELFLIRLGDHDIAIDPRMLLSGRADQGLSAGLWVEGLPMARSNEAVDLPNPDSLPAGLLIDQENSRLVSRSSLGSVFPIDIVAEESFESFWDRYLLVLIGAGALGGGIAVVWILLVTRYSRYRYSLPSQLRDALSRGHIEAYYQPIISLQNGRCVGAEALARWIRDDGETVPPDTFIVIAEAAGLVPRITKALLRATLRDLGELLQAHPDLCININLAAEDLKSEALQDELKHQLQRYRVPASSIKLEITERAMIDSDECRERISAMRRSGHAVAVDDFGTGYSSLSYLEKFELDTLKIDKAFIDAIGTESVTSPVVDHVIEMAKSLKLDIVAEGIETSRQRRWLKERDVDYGQGFLFSPALPADEFAAYVEQHEDNDTSSQAVCAS